MRKKNQISSIRRIRKGMLIVTLLIVLGSVLMFAMVEFVSYKVFTKSDSYNPVDAFGMIIPMSAILGFASYRTLKISDKHYSKLITGITRIAEGNFNVILDEEGSGPFSEIFANFNKMSRELTGVQTLREDFVSQFSHEFKNPIMSINGFASLMIEEELPREEQIQYLKIIESESKRLAELSHNTLLLAKLESQQLILNRQKYQLDEQIKEIIILLEPSWSKKEIDISAKLSPISWYGNKDIMSQLWINLITNAITHTPRKGIIEISLKEKENTIQFKVKDNGSGIAEEDIPLIFNKYYRAKNNHSTKGLGLGLSIASRIVSLCEGEILVKSEIDEGTEFKVLLHPYQEKHEKKENDERK